MKALREVDLCRAYKMLDDLEPDEVKLRLNKAILQGRVRQVKQGLYMLATQRDSPGFRRMKERLGPDAAEKLRQDTVRLQQEALNSVRK